MDSQEDLFATIQPDIKTELSRPVPEVIPPTLAERFAAFVEQHSGLLPPAGRVNGRTIRAKCRFCGGKGCLNCDTLAQEAYQQQFPNGPQPLMTFRRNDPQDMDLLKQLFETVQAMRTEPGGSCP